MGRRGMAVACAVLGCALSLGLGTSQGLGAAGNIGVGLKHDISTAVFVPDGQGPFPGMLVLEKSLGVEPLTLQYARRLADAGYVSFVPYYMEAYGLVGERRGEAFTRSADAILADLAEAANELRHYEKVGGRKVGAVGFSNGGFFAVMLAAHGDVQAAVDYYGAITGFGTDKELFRIKSALTAQSSPMLLLVGDKDGYYRPTLHLGALLRDAQVPHVVHVYPGDPHEFEKFSARDAEDAWGRTIAFLGRWLK